MKISKMPISRRLKSLALIAFALFSFTYNIHAQEAEEDFTPDATIGEGLFKGNCASCHKPHEDMTGPKLQGARERWIENSSEENFYKWIRNSQGLIAEGDSYAKSLFAEWGSVMTPQALDNNQIDHIFAYVESYVPPTVTDGPTENGGGPKEEGGAGWFWWLLAVLLIIVIGTVGGVRAQLRKVANKQEGIEEDPNETLIQVARKRAWENRGIVGVITLVVVVGLLVLGMLDLMRIGVFEDYKPEQPIEFSHQVHAGKLGVDCKYCHNSVTKSKHAGIPTVNVCMNCHKAVSEGTETGTKEIAKIYDAAGWDPETNTYSGKTKKIEWVKVHNLPDHVYFNHSQHVVVGKLDCAQCHGDMKNETVARVMTTEDLNAVEENKIKFSKPTLTMGWCIECHRQATVDIAGAYSNDSTSYYGVIHERLLLDKRTYQSYLEDDVVTVAELGGMECAKCHY